MRNLERVSAQFSLFYSRAHEANSAPILKSFEGGSNLLILLDKCSVEDAALWGITLAGPG